MLNCSRALRGVMRWFVESPISKIRAHWDNDPRNAEFIPPQRRYVLEHRNNSNAFANIALKRYECRAPFTRIMESFPVAFTLALLLVVASIRSAAAQNPTKQDAAAKGSAAFYEMFPDKVLARGKGFEIRQSQVDEMYLAFKSHRAAIGVQVPNGARAQVEAEILEKLIATKLCLSRATPDDRSHASGLAGKFVAEQIKLAPSEESFNRQLLAVGMTPEKFQAQVLEQAIVKSVIDREVAVFLAVTDAQVREFYEKNPALFQVPELVRVSHILISTQSSDPKYPISEPEKMQKRRLADSVLVRAKAGEDFSKLVGEFSDDEASKEKGGIYSIARAAEDPNRAVVPEFEAAAFSLGLNKISDIVATRYGYHIIKMLEKIPVRRNELAAVAARIKETLLQEEIQKALPDFIAKLKKENGVEILSNKPAN